MVHTENAGTYSPVGEWDSQQKDVIESPAGFRLIVDAGPGTGKTAVACARLAHLITNEDVAPSKTWMISFTRTAISEIRARLHSYIGDAAFGVKVATVDAHAWTIHSGFDVKASLTGSYDQNIGRVLEMVTSDEEVVDYLQNIEHLIIDEAQDLVGVRADLVEALVLRLDPDCGVTIFADEAQAIYGFSEDDDDGDGEKSASLLDRLRANTAAGFESAPLEVIHRTSSKGLRSIFSDVRKSVLGGRRSGEDLFSRIRDSITRHADNDDVQFMQLGLETMAAGTLVLFRTRSEALQASQFCQTPHSLRLSGYGANLPPWLGACFWDFTSPFLGKEDFEKRWAHRVDAGIAPGYSREEAWARLTRLAASADGSVEMHQLRQILGRRNPPVDLLIPEFGLPGPIIGTIHASKGREADNVILLMPPEQEFESLDEEEEETRVLFVGSTRARNTLRVGLGKALQRSGRRLESGRAFKRLAAKGKGAKSVGAMMEIGRLEDLTPDGLVGTAHQSASEALSSQKWLLQHAGVVSSFKLLRDPDLDWRYRLVRREDESPVALCSQALREDFWKIAKILKGNGKASIHPPVAVPFINGMGCCTRVISPDDATAEVLHSPWSQSGFVIAPRIAAYTKANFWKSR